VFHIIKSNCVRFDILNLGGMRNDSDEVREGECWNRGIFSWYSTSKHVSRNSKFMPRDR
jgi:hypothetical protein